MSETKPTKKIKKNQEKKIFPNFVLESVFENTCDPVGDLLFKFYQSLKKDAQ